MELLFLSLFVGVLFQSKCLQVGNEALQLDVIIGRNCFGFEQVERIVEPPAERLEQHGVLLDEASLFLVDHNRLEVSILVINWSSPSSDHKSLLFLAELGSDEAARAVWRCTATICK